MSKLQWWRAYSRMIDDDRLRLVAFEDRWHFVALCCLKCEGLLDDQDPDLRMRRVAVKMGLQLRDLEEVHRRLFEVGLIDENMSPKAWDELQYKSDTSSERVRKHRAKTKASKVKRPCNVSVTAPETETDTETNKKERVRVSEYPDDFEEFWNAWLSSGGGGDKAPAFTAWKSLNDPDRQLAASIAAQWFEAWRKSAPESAKAIHASTYLNKRRFDGFEPPTSGRTISMAGKSVVTNSDPLWPALVERNRREKGRGVNAESWAFDDAWIADARSTLRPTDDDLDRSLHMQDLMSSVGGNA